MFSAPFTQTHTHVFTPPTSVLQLQSCWACNPNIEFVHSTWIKFHCAATSVGLAYLGVQRSRRRVRDNAKKCFLSTRAVCFVHYWTGGEFLMLLLAPCPQRRWKSASTSAGMVLSLLARQELFLSILSSAVFPKTPWSRQQPYSEGGGVGPFILLSLSLSTTMAAYEFIIQT